MMAVAQLSPSLFNLFFRLSFFTALRTWQVLPGNFAVQPRFRQVVACDNMIDTLEEEADDDDDNSQIVPIMVMDLEQQVIYLSKQRRPLRTSKYAKILRKILRALKICYTNITTQLIILLLGFSDAF